MPITDLLARPMGPDAQGIMSPLDVQARVASLRDLMAGSQLKQMEVQQNQMNLALQQRMAQWRATPGNVDPITAQATDQGLMNLDPSLRPAAAAARQKWELENADIAEKRQKTSEAQVKQSLEKAGFVNENLYGPAMVAYEKALTTVPNSPDGQEQARRMAQEAYSTQYDFLATSGAITPDELKKIPRDFNPAKVSAESKALKDYHAEQKAAKAAETAAKDPLIKNAESIANLKADSMNLPAGSPEREKFVKAAELKYMEENSPKNLRQITHVSVAGEGGGKAPSGYRWSDKDKTKLEPIPGGPAGTLSDEGIKFAIQQSFAGDSTALQGFARNASMRAKIANMIPSVAEEMGLTPQDVAIKKAEFQGFVQGERTVGTRQAQIEMAGQVLNQFIPIAKDASAAYKRSGVKTINDLQKFVQGKTSSPELRKLNASVNAVINAYGRAINPTGVGNEADKAEARKILDSAFASGDFDAAIDQMQLEINAELKAPAKVKSGMRDLAKAATADTAPAATSSTHAELPDAAKYNGKTATDTETGIRYKSVNGQWVKQ